MFNVARHIMLQHNLCIVITDHLHLIFLSCVSVCVFVIHSVIENVDFVFCSSFFVVCFWV